MYSRFQVPLSDLGYTQAAGLLHKKRPGYTNYFPFASLDSNCLSSSAQDAHSGSKCGWADLLSPVKLLANVDTFLFWTADRSW